MDITNIPSFDSSVTATVENLQTSGGYLNFFEVQNPNTVQAFLQVFSVPAASVILGTTAPTQSYMVPPGDGNASGGRSEMFSDPPFFRSGISYAVTTTATGLTALTSVCGVGFIRH